MSLFPRPVDDVAQPRHQSERRSDVVAQPARDGVGGGEADAADLLREAVRVLTDHGHRMLAVLLMNAERPRAAETM